MPYSDGVDSRAVSALVDNAEKGGLVRVRLGTKGADTHSGDPRERRFMSVPYQVRFDVGQRVESSARSRGFKFAVITGIAAALANVERIVVTESGQGALGPILVTLGQSHPDYRVHPAFTRRIEALFEALTGKAPHYEYPPHLVDQGRNRHSGAGARPATPAGRTPARAGRVLGR